MTEPGVGVCGDVGGWWWCPCSCLTAGSPVVVRVGTVEEREAQCAEPTPTTNLEQSRPGGGEGVAGYHTSLTPPSLPHSLTPSQYPQYQFRGVSSSPWSGVKCEVNYTEIQ